MLGNILSEQGIKQSNVYVLGQVMNHTTTRSRTTRSPTLT
ncbi:hypothetical protein DSUL_100214 [Desulfovibrionales bacterium]